MRHRQLTEQAKGEPFNKVALKIVGYTTLTAVIVAAIVQVIAYGPEIDGSVKIVLELLGFIFLVTFAVQRVYNHLIKH